MPKVSKAGGSSKKFGLKDALDNLGSIAAEGRRQQSKQVDKLLAVLAKGLGLDILSFENKAAELPKCGRNKRTGKASAPTLILKAQHNKW